jgi:hypothetical protein
MQQLGHRQVVGVVRDHQQVRAGAAGQCVDGDQGIVDQVSGDGVRNGHRPPDAPIAAAPAAVLDALVRAYRFRCGADA